MKLRVAAAQIKPAKADYAENLRTIGGVLGAVSLWDSPPDLVLFPETIMSGLFVEAGVRECAVTAGGLCNDLAAMHSAVGAPPLDVVVGFYEEFGNRYFNSAVYVTLDRGEPLIRHVHRKVFLPTYGMFDEKRFVNHGRSVSAFDTGWGRASILICEDVWHSVTGALAALDGAQIVLVPSAAPARGIGPSPESTEDGIPRPASVRTWERMIRRVADENGVFVVLSQPVGFEAGKAFQGGSAIVAPNGDLIVRAPAFDEALIVADVDFDAISRTRTEEPMLADLENQFAGLLELSGSESGVVQFDVEGPSYDVSQAPTPGTYPVVESPEVTDPLAIDPELTARWLEAFIEDEVVRRRGFEKVVVGLSGGVDSSLTAALAARALGPENVIGVRMPYRTSSEDSLEHASMLAEKLGIELVTVDISAAVDAFLKAADDQADETRRGNVMARMRMITLFDLSAKHQALPLGSGNKTERLFGYFTWHGDDSPPINPLGDLFKSQIWALARYVGVPEGIVTKPPSADLIRGQTDEADLGIPYPKADRILHWLLSGYRPSQIVDFGCEVAEVELVRTMLNRTHWKRHLPTVAMVSDTAIGESYLRPKDY
jgi:NAD+ synthetase